jgi:hypothetical protein
MGSGDTSNKVSRPSFDEMIISVTRHRKSDEDDAFTYQFPVEVLKDDDEDSDPSCDYLEEDAFKDLKTKLEHRLKISLTGMSTMWCLAQSTQLAIVNDRDSLCAAIMNHQYAGEDVVELRVVKNSGKIRRKFNQVSADN